ncbi:MAG: ABC transporter ATP-binding protein/permease [Clostridia bacterium]|nr:ABC transporter ATP-binding protein/permease [Clostridia bacterium]
MFIAKQDMRILKKVLALFKPYKKEIAAIIIIMLVSAGINMIIPLISKQMMDKGILEKNVLMVIKFSIASLCLILLDQGFGMLETKYRAYINSLMSYELSKNAFRHILKLKMKYFNNTNFAEVMNNVNMDVTNISKISDRGTFFIVTQVFRIIGGIIGLILIDWKLTILVLSIIPLRYKLVKYLAKKRRDMFEKYMEYNREFSSWYGDTISGVKEIKLWGIHRLKLGEFIKKQRNIIKVNINLNIVDKLNELSESIVFQVIISVLYILGVNMIISGSLTVGGLFAFVTYSVYVTGPMSAILNIGYNFSNIIPSAKRLFNLMEMECEYGKVAAKAIRLDRDSTQGSIKFDDVSFSYDNSGRLLKNISFDIKNGEKVAIIGTNGSGKSTLINLLLRFYDPQSGKILLDDVDIRQINLIDYRKIISVVSQDLYLFNTTVKENIGISDGSADIFKASKDSTAHEFIKELPLKYNTVVGRNGANLSGGERQKIALARALAKDSRILVLDEATSNCDVESELYINELLNNRAFNKTVIVVTHRPDILKGVDRIIIIDNGVISDMGTHDELYLRSTAYKSIINIDSSVGRKNAV